MKILRKTVFFSMFIGLGCTVSEFVRSRPQTLASSEAEGATLARAATRTESAASEQAGAAPFEVSYTALLARWNALRGDPYELDEIERFVDESGRLECATCSQFVRDVEAPAPRLMRTGALFAGQMAPTP